MGPASMGGVVAIKRLGETSRWVAPILSDPNRLAGERRDRLDAASTGLRLGEWSKDWLVKKWWQLMKRLLATCLHFLTNPFFDPRLVSNTSGTEARIFSRSKIT